MKEIASFVLSFVAVFMAMSASNATVLTAFDGKYAGNVSNAATYKLTTPDTDGIAVDFTFRFTPTNAKGVVGDLQNNDFLGFWFNSPTGPSIGLKANCGDGSCTDDVFVRLGGTGGVYLPGSDLKSGTDYRIFGYLSKSQGSAVYDNFDAWLNPTASEMQSLTHPDAHIDSLTKGAGSNLYGAIGSVGFRSANLDHGVIVTVKNATLDQNAAAAEADAAQVPEPGSLALMGVAMVGLGAARRRKKA